MSKTIDTDQVVNEAIAFAYSAAQEAYDAVLEQEQDDPSMTDPRQGAWLAARHAFVCNLPPLSSRANVVAYIAVIAKGQSTQHLNGDQARALLYAAQLALAALRETPADRTTLQGQTPPPTLPATTPTPPATLPSVKASGRLPALRAASAQHEAELRNALLDFIAVQEDMGDAARLMAAAIRLLNPEIVGGSLAVQG